MIKRAKLWPLVILLAGSAFSANGADQQSMSDAIEHRVSGAEFTGAVLVSRGSTILVNKGYGSANLEWQMPNSPATRFRVASLTKQFTAAAIMLLEQRGMLRIEDPVSKYLPDAPAAWRSITVFNLLTHTSGIPDLTTFPDFAERVTQRTTPEQLVGSFRDKPLDFPPGTDFRYSNSGYILLGYILEKVSGQSYADFIQKNIFVPLGMKSSGYDSNAAIVPMRAQGYAQRAGGVAIADYLDMTVPFSAGGLYSTTRDLLRWEHGLFDGQLLSPSSLARMTTPFKKDYAFGIAVDTDTNGNKVVWHGGAIDGFTVFMAYVPAEKFAVVVLANIEGAPAKAIAADILAIAGYAVPAIRGK
jgi:CubicO group peptidase (beta-lactamase class C family)